MTMGPDGITRATGTDPTKDPTAFRENALFDLGNIGGAFRNALREMGFSLNPFHGFAEDLVEQFAPAAFSQYASLVATGGRPGASVGSRGADLKSFLTDYIKGGMGMGGGIQPWNYTQAMQGVGAVNALLRQVGEKLSGLGYSPTDIAGMDNAKRNEVLAQAGIDPLQASIAALIGSRPDMMRGFMGGAYAPSLGPSLSKALNTVLAYQQQNWDDYIKAATFQPGVRNLPTFLDLITGSGTP